MLNATEAHSNVSVSQGLLGRVMFSTLCTIPCCVCLFANGVMLFILRSKSVFRETSRYILLYNLLFADTVVLAVSQLLYILAACKITLTYPVCGVLVLLADAAAVISPLTLVVMSLERYVAVCYPLRHSSVITIRNTAVAIFVVWAFSSLNVLFQVALFIYYPFDDLQTLQMRHFCGKESMLFIQIAYLFDKAYTYFLFLTAAVAVGWSYVAVMIACRSASTDKDSAQKARNTLLLHLVQLGLSLFSTIYNVLIISMLKVLDGVVVLRMQNVLYIFVIIFPRCLSSLIYGLRDQTIRPMLIRNLFCQWKHSLSVTS